MMAIAMPELSDGDKRALGELYRYGEYLFTILADIEEYREIADFVRTGETARRFRASWMALGLRPLNAAVASTLGDPMKWSSLNTLHLPDQPAGNTAHMSDDLATPAGRKERTDDEIVEEERRDLSTGLKRAEAYLVISSYHLRGRKADSAADLALETAARCAQLHDLMESFG